jgi:hypothetical protein
MALVADLQAATAERLGSDRWMPIVTLAGPPWPPDGVTSPSRSTPPTARPSAGLPGRAMPGAYQPATSCRHLRAVQ